MQNCHEQHHSCYRYIVIIVIPIILAGFIYYLRFNHDAEVNCYKGDSNICRPTCPNGQFILPGMRRCKKWLTCDDILKDDFVVETDTLLGRGVVKKVYLAKWREHNVAYNILREELYKEDFEHGSKMLHDLQPSDHVTLFIGSCQDSYITQYHKLGSARNILDVLRKIKDIDSLQRRLALCANYVEIVNFLHNSPIGTRVMCDSNDLDKLLSQYLITDNLTLVVNDLDALPVLNLENKTIKCGTRQIISSFAAPEQLWPYQTDYDDKKMPGYDEKTDVWKLPDVCDYFLGSIPGSDLLRFKLFKIHKECKSTLATDRPSAADVLAIYRALLT